ncbi:DUF7133 domain-containing protein [Roseibacillus ishigakijimensis]|uniref:C-type cytochrome n=1 Tax=Roseibacillus ishigakijimensis TaxID=454146 RepID=A0A934RNA0_9BACT|nr:c-type cytochrome [Roseibacillus ishigakijimensis]MBK1833920.1 c-type cytochrome [Roseibacillus ishigakijimensis]
MRPLTLLTLALGSLCAAGEQIDLVTLGEETFSSLGCIECHSVLPDDSSVKTGPGLYGLFQKEARDHRVQAADAKKEVTADRAFLLRSLREPTAELALKDENEAYLPVMPPYNEQLLPNQKVEALFAYLQTLNDPAQAGPSEVLVEKVGEADQGGALADAAEILVTDRTRIFRARLGKTSARAVHVGTPVGINYSFDPRTLSIERLWWGGFLNLREELSGRAGKVSRLGEQAQEVELGGSLLAPLDPATGQPIDLSFKSPTHADEQQIIANMKGAAEFLDQLAEASGHFLGYEEGEAPTFVYRVGANTFQVRLAINAEGAAKLTLQGQLTHPQTFRLSPLIRGQAEDWTVRQLPAELTFQVPVKPAWRPWEAQSQREPQAVVTSAPDKLVLPTGYGAEVIQPPLDVNGRRQLFEPMGMAETAEGALIVSTRTAGLWKLQNGQWQQIAEGLLDALGLVVEDENTLVVGQKPELTRLRDTDGDGWMDRYETLCDDFLFTHNYHEYLHGPTRGADGNYYIQLNLGHRGNPKNNHMAGGKFMGTQGGLRAWALQVTPEGQMTPFANGLRSPAGLATGPDGRLYYTENQGEYVGTSKLFVLEKDKFYGHPASLIDLPGRHPDSPEIAWEKVQQSKEKALALMPHSRLANAPGSPAWAPAESDFARFAGHMFVGDQTLSQIFRILPKEDHEAALIPFAHGFASGVMRLHFASDGSLLVGQTGRGWRAQGGSEDGLVRLSRAEESLSNELLDLTREGATFTLHFAEALAQAPAAEALTVQSWEYHDSPDYGSKELRKTDWKITRVSLGENRRQLQVTLRELTPPEDNRVFALESKSLPGTKGDLLQAYYSQTVR